MRIFSGSYNTLYYSTDDELQAILNGEIFCTRFGGDYYYRSIPFSLCSNVEVPENLVCLEKSYNNSKHAPKSRIFYRLVKGTNIKVFYGDSLKQHLVDHLGLWMEVINPKTMKGFYGGRDFRSFINAIPVRVISDADFCEAAKDRMKKEVVGRIQTAENLEQIKSFQELYTNAETAINDAHAAGVQHYVDSKKVADEGEKALNEARQNAIAALNKPGKGGK